MNMKQLKNYQIMKQKFFLAFLVVLGLASTNLEMRGETALSSYGNPGEFITQELGEGDVPETGKVYYILNESSGRFLNSTFRRWTSWGTRAMVSEYSSSRDANYKFNLVGGDANVYTLSSAGTRMNDNDDGTANYNGILFGDASGGFYVDGATSQASRFWKIENIDVDSYSIQNTLIQDGSYFSPKKEIGLTAVYHTTDATYRNWKFYEATADVTTKLAAIAPRFPLYMKLTQAKELLDIVADDAVAVVFNTAVSVYNNVGSTASQLSAEITNLNTALTTSTIYNNLLVNGGMTSNPSGNGWVVENGTWGSNAYEIYNKVGHATQTVSLQPGIYKLFAQAFLRWQGPGKNNNLSNGYLNGTEVNNCYLFAKNSDAVTTQVKINSIYDGEYFPDRTTGFLYGISNTPAAGRELFDMGVYPVSLEFSNITAGDVEIGVNAGEGNSARWALFSDFKLMRVGDLPSNATQEQLDEISALCTSADALLLQVIESTLVETLTEKSNAAKEISLTSTLELANQAILELSAAVSAAQSSADIYAKIPQAVTVANSRMAYYVSYADYADFEEAVTSAIGTLNSVYTTRTADVVAVDLALTTFGTTYNTLEKTLRTPSSGTEYTMAITNPNFSSAPAAPWQGYTGTYAGGVYEFYQANFDMYQDLDVPAGVYELGVQGFVRVTWNDAASNYMRSLEDVSYYLYAEIAGSSPKKEWMIPLASLYSDENTGSTNGYANSTGEANTAFNTSQKYQANALKAIEVGEGETLRIGIRGSGTAAGRWVCFDNFALTQISAASSTATQAEIDALKVLTDKAESLLAGDISPAAAVLETERGLHLAYEANVTESSVVQAAIQTMKTAIETYRSAYIKNYSFEDLTDPSTTGVSPTLTNWTRNYTDGYNWNGCNGDWTTDGERSYGIWKAAIDSDFELSQVVTVPNGMYLVTVDMTVSKSGTTSRVNGQRLFAGHIEAYYPAYAETDADNGSAYTLAVMTVVNDGQLKLGVRTNGGANSGIGWFKIDNFTIRQVSTYTKLELIDWMDFNATENQTIDVSYLRTFMTTGVNSTTTNGWQSLCLPFDVTEIEIADTYSQSYIDLTDKANEKFWLYKITESGYTPAYSIEAHEYYLIALPNDEDYYSEGVSLSGDVTFYGTEVLATPALPQVEMPFFYVQANFKATNSGYGITDVDNNSVFKQNHNNGAFWVHAFPKDGNGSYTAFNVFGTTDPTSLRQTELGDAASQLAVVSVEGGLEITVAVSQMIRVYTIGGELVKTLKVPAGTTRINLPAGHYVVNGQKTVVTN